MRPLLVDTSKGARHSTILQPSLHKTLFDDAHRTLMLAAQLQLSLLLEP